jgi:hypothetical protein
MPIRSRYDLDRIANPNALVHFSLDLKPHAFDFGVFYSTRQDRLYISAVFQILESTTWVPYKSIPLHKVMDYTVLPNLSHSGRHKYRSFRVSKNSQNSPRNDFWVLPLTAGC